MTETSMKLVKNVVVDYKDITSWILLGILILAGILQYLQNVKLAKTVEKFKDELARNQIKFTRHTELQIECLKKMYDQVVTFHFTFLNLINPPYKTHKSLKKNLERIQEIFIETLNYSHRNKILITDDIVNQIRVIHNKFNEIEIICISEHDNLNQLEDYNNTDVTEHIYRSPNDEVESIQLAINRLNENQDVKTFEADILKLRALIENYFKTLVG